MDIFAGRRTIDEKYEQIIKEKFNDHSFNPYFLIRFDDKDEDYRLSLEIFHFLFSLGGEAHIYLWNEMWWVFNASAMIDKNDYSEEEISFIESMDHTFSQTSLKYGDEVSVNKNINKKMETGRLILCPYDNDLGEKYLDFLEQNQEEFKNYYGKEFNRYEAENWFNPAHHHLAFAIIEKERNNYIGSVALTLIRSDCAYNIEYIIMPQYRNQGYASEAVEKIIDCSKNKEFHILEETIKKGVFVEVTLNIKCIEAKIRVNNNASLRLIKRMGFQFMGKIPFFQTIDGVCVNGETYDLIL